MLCVGHLLGGASSAGAAAALTLAVAAAALVGLWRRGQPFPERYASRVLGPATAGAVLLALAVVSLMPGSERLAGGSLAAAVGSRTLAVAPEAARVEILKICGLAVAFFAAQACAATPARLRATLRWLLCAGAVWAATTLLLFAAHSDVTAPDRLRGAFVSPNTAGALLDLLLLISLTEALVDAGSRRRNLRPSRRVANLLPRLALGLLFLICLMLTASRAAILLGVGGFGAAGAGLLIRRLSRRRGWPRDTTRLWILSLSAVALGLAATGARVSERLAGTAVDARDRLIIVEAFADAAAQAPWFGYGLGAAPALSRMLLTPENYTTLWNVRAPHNVVVQWWLEAGLIGAALAAYALCSLLWSAWRGLCAEGRRRLWPLALVGPLLLLQGLVDYAVQIYSVALTWAFLLGLQFTVAATGKVFWTHPRSGRAVHASSAGKRSAMNPGSPLPSRSPADESPTSPVLAAP